MRVGAELVITRPPRISTSRKDLASFFLLLLRVLEVSPVLSPESGVL